MENEPEIDIKKETGLSAEEIDELYSKVQEVFKGYDISWVTTMCTKIIIDIALENEIDKNIFVERFLISYDITKDFREKMKNEK